MSRRDRHYRAVKRNVDKPHRCPSCHRVVDRARLRRGYGTRTWFSCPGDCRLRWRAGVTASRHWRPFDHDEMWRRTPVWAAYLFTPAERARRRRRWRHRAAR